MTAGGGLLYKQHPMLSDTSKFTIAIQLFYDGMGTTKPLHGQSSLCNVGVFLANVNSRSRSLYVVVRPSVVCLLRSCTLLRRFKFSAMFLRHLIHCWSDDIQVKFYRDHPRGTPPSGELNTIGVAILDISEAISRKRCKIGGKLLLITNKKLHMSFRLVPKSVTLDGLEQRNSPN